MSVAGTTTSFAHEFRALCGAEHVIEDLVKLKEFQILGVTPAVAVFPTSSEEVAAILRVANEHRLNVVPAGGFTQQQSGNLPSRIDVLLLTSCLTAVEHYDPGDLTVGVGAGCTISRLSSMVATDSLLLALDPPLPERCTIGGALATAASGPLRHSYGSLRDFCLGIRFVTGDGRRAKGGGRVVKNVAGYDLMKLLIGSQGSLAVITSASFKLFPAPRQTRTFLAEFASAPEALSFRDAILRSPLSPMCLELVSPPARDIMKPGMSSATWVICIRAAGSDSVLARYRSELGSAITREIDAQREAELWEAVVAFRESVRAMHPRSLVLSFSMPLRDVQLTIAILESVAEFHGLDIALIGRAGIGHLEAALWPIAKQEVSLANLMTATSLLRSKLSHDSSMSVLYCPLEARADIPAWGPSPTHLESMRAVKNALDGKDVLNRGRFLS